MSKIRIAVASAALLLISTAALVHLRAEERLVKLLPAPHVEACCGSDPPPCPPACR